MSSSAAAAGAPAPRPQDSDGPSTARARNMSSSHHGQLPPPVAQPSRNQSQHANHHQRHLSHHEEAQMRELDADILELGITQPGTPVLSPIRGGGGSKRSSVSSVVSGVGDAMSTISGAGSEPDRLPLLPESAVVDSEVMTAGLASNLPLSSPSSAFGSSVSLEQQSASMEDAAADGIAGIPALPTTPKTAKASYRRCLSGDDSQISTVGRSGSVTTGSSSFVVKTPKRDDTAAATATADTAAAAAAAAAAAGGDTTGVRDKRRDGSPNSVANGSSATVATAELTVVDRNGDAESLLSIPADDNMDKSTDQTREEALKSNNEQQQEDEDGQTAPLSPAHLATARDCREHPADVVHDASAEHLERCRTQRSESIDRAFNEAVQFAEAVGEAPPTNEDELRVIIEADSSSDDDYSDVDMMDEEEMAAELAEMEKDEDAVESSFRRGNSFRDDRDLVAKSPRMDKAKYRRDVQGTEASGENGVSSSALNLSSHSAMGGLPAAPDLGSPGSQRRREDFASSKREEDDVVVSDSREESPQERRIYPRLPPLKQAPTSTSGCRSHHHMTLLNKKGPNGVVYDTSSHSSTVIEYKGIHSKELEVTNRGISRGNYAKLHRKAWLEVSDKYHRYGKNLRLYYKHWESLGHPTNMFFDWLDSKGEAAGQPLPNLLECPRAELDSDTVLYITNPEVQERYRLSIVTDVVVDADECGPEFSDNDSDRYSDTSKGDAILVDADEEPVWTGHEGWIFVLRDHALYAGQKVTSVSGISKQRFHHSSFFGGKAVAAAGIIITDQHGRLRRMYPHSGHYRPTEAHMQRMLYFLQQGGFDLTTFEVDTQQILHVSRTVRTAPKGGATNGDNGKGGDQKENVAADDNNAAPEAAASKKLKKVQSLHLKPALYVACFLAHKARMIGEGVFAQIHKIRTEGVASVSEALEHVDEGGYWKKLRTLTTMAQNYDSSYFTSTGEIS